MARKQPNGKDNLKAGVRKLLEDAGIDYEENVTVATKGKRSKPVKTAARKPAAKTRKGRALPSNVEIARRLDDESSDDAQGDRTDEGGGREGSVTSERGCGTQTAGGIYAMCPLSPFGQPIEYFLIDSPRLEIPPHVKPRGTSFIEDTCHECKGSGNATSSGNVIEEIARHIVGKLLNPGAMTPPPGKCGACFGSGTLTHLVDWIGENNYPSVADFIEETRLLGMSRKLSPKMDYSRLTPGSRHMMIHPRAHIVKFKDYFKAEAEFSEGANLKACPQGLPNHFQERMCARLFWQDIYGGEPLGDPRDPREVRKQLPCKAVYSGLTSLYDEGRKKESKAGRYKPAFFLWLPIQLIGVIAAPSNREKEKQAVAAAKKAHIPVRIIEEE
jgi:hypothetical protein